MAGAGLYAAVVRLQARDVVSPAHGRLAHAAFLRWIAEVDPVLAAGLHQDQRPRPFTVALLALRGLPLRELALRCTILDDALFTAFTQRLAATPEPEVRLGTAIYEVLEVTTAPAPHGWSEQTTWEELLTGADASRQIAVEFASPTCFSLGREEGRQRVELLPQTDLLWESWARRWDQCAPEPLGSRAVADLAARWAILADYRLQTRTLDYGRFKQKGFVGEARYELRSGVPEEAARRLNLLADFAFYAGSGYKTTQGLGLTRRQR